jgi:long-chain fatty acid transport protein
MKIKKILPVVTAASMLLVSAQTVAGGFGIIEHSASGMGNAFAGGAAGAEDASTVWFNPAGMTRLDNEMLAAAHIILPNAKYTDTGSSVSSTLTAINSSYTTLDPSNTNRSAEGGKNALIPNLYWVKEIKKDLKFGLGINVPFGLGTDYDDDWVGRYHAVKSDAMSLNINPSIAYKAGNVSLGFGVSAQYIKVELTSAIDLGTLCVAQEALAVLPPGTCSALGATPQAKDGFADLDGDGWAYGYNFGVLYDVNEDIRVGFAYRSSVDHDVSGNADFTIPGELSFLTAKGSFIDTTLTASVSLLESTSISYFHNINEKIAIMADYTITGWSSFEELRIDYAGLQSDTVTTQDWDDSARISFGLNYRHSPKWLYRFGVARDEGVIPSAERRTPRIPGTDRTWIAFGVTHQIDKDRSFSLGYAHLFIDDTEINNTYESSAASVLEHTLTGTYKANVDILSAQVSWKY